MALPKEVTFVTFDVYGTLIDWDSGAYDAFDREAKRDGFTLERDEVIQAALGPIAAEFLRLKRAEWDEYHRQVTTWEVERYLTLL